MGGPWYLGCSESIVSSSRRAALADSESLADLFLKMKSEVRCLQPHLLDPQDRKPTAVRRARGQRHQAFFPFSVSDAQLQETLGDDHLRFLDQSIPFRSSVNKKWALVMGIPEPDVNSKTEQNCEAEHGC